MSGPVIDSSPGHATLTSICAVYCWRHTDVYKMYVFELLNQPTNTYIETKWMLLTVDAFQYMR